LVYFAVGLNLVFVLNGVQIDFTVVHETMPNE